MQLGVGWGGETEAKPLREGQRDGQDCDSYVGALEFDFSLLRDKARMPLLCLAWSAGTGYQLR